MWTAFIFGLGGSLHCIGMCGPIATMIPGGAGTSSAQKLLKALAYNLGRISIYSLLGYLFGFFGKGIFIAGYQQTISIVFGILIVLGVLFPVVMRKFKPNSILFSKVNQLKNSILPLLNKNSAGGSYVIGLLNALLPCGLVYMALGGAIMMGDPIWSAKYMFFFGVGTAGVMLLVSMGSGFVFQNYRRKLLKVVPYLMFLVGVLFILRGMNLGIPYVSPEIEEGQSVQCH